MSKLNFNFRNFLQLGFKLSKSMQRNLQMSLDGLAIFISFASAMLLRLETTNFFYEPKFFISYVLILLPTILVFSSMGLYRAFVRYISTEVAVLVALGSSISGFFIILNKLAHVPFIPWSVSIIYSALLFIVITGSRFTLRSIFRTYNQKTQKYVAIYGAGAAGAQLTQSLITSPEYRVQMIIDDNKNLQGQQLYGLKVMSFEEASDNFDNLEVDVILLAMPSASFHERQGIISKVNKYVLKVKTIPAVDSLINGSAQITEFKDIAIEDLLGRERVDPIQKLLNKNITNKTVLVTGAGGSIGSELTRQILQLKPLQLILFDISELGIYNITSEIDEQALKLNVPIHKLVGSVQDRVFIATTLQKFKVDTIYHAAAYKHVPLMENNALQAIKNNTIGTMTLAKEAVRAKVTNFSLISTDKAVKPKNVMGASKRLAERICQAINLEQTVTKFSMVRFGNVLGSSGSVVPLFQKQIAKGGPITLTHPNVTRYFMTIGEAVQLVIQSGSLTAEGKLFVLDMGVPLKIKDLAFKMIKLSGLRPYLETDVIEEKGDILVRITGLRPGEKLYEELSYGDNLFGTTHPRIMKVDEATIAPKKMWMLIDKLKILIKEQDHDGLIKYLIQNADYQPDEKLLTKKKQLISVTKEIKRDEVIHLPINKK